MKKVLALLFCVGVLLTSCGTRNTSLSIIQDPPSSFSPTKISAPVGADPDVMNMLELDDNHLTDLITNFCTETGYKDYEVVFISGKDLPSWYVGAFDGALYRVITSDYSTIISIEEESSQSIYSAFEALRLDKVMTAK